MKAVFVFVPRAGLVKKGFTSLDKLTDYLERHGSYVPGVGVHAESNGRVMANEAYLGRWELIEIDAQ